MPTTYEFPELPVLHGAALARLSDGGCRPGQPATTVRGYDQELSGEPVLPGFQLDLRPLRR